MNKKTYSVLTGALITGLLAGSVAMADANQKDQQSGDTQEMSGTKNSCSGKTADKNSCAGKKDKKSKGKKDAKNSCSGKNGCGEKQEK